MKLPASAAVALSLTLAAGNQHAQTPFSDPANLRGERVRPKTGRELPIDGGQDHGALGLQQLLRKLSTRASLMLIVAHPDDEDGGMLTYYSRGLGARVADLSLTRGEGGQNAVTGDFEDALGLIRTQELLAADRYSGTDQLFGTEVDFGFSKTKQEAFRKWTHERVLYDAVRAVRLYRPLVLAAVFVGGVTDGHGQHQVSGEIAQEVFKAAADPAVFPELTREGILPWAPAKVYARVPSFAITGKGLFDYATNEYVPPSFTNYVTGQTTTTPPTADVIVHEGQVDPLLTDAAANPADLPERSKAPATPLSYVQFARIGLGLQRTQIGPGVRLARPGTFDVGYHLYGTRLCAGSTGVATLHPGAATGPCPNATAPKPEAASFFDGIDTTLGGIVTLSSAPPRELRDGLRELTEALASVQAALDPAHPSTSAPALTAAQQKLGALLSLLEERSFAGKADVLHELRVKQAQLNDAIVCALGLNFRAEVSGPSADVLRDAHVTVQTQLTTSSAESVGIFSESLESDAKTRNERLLAVDTEPVLSARVPVSSQLEAKPALTAQVTRPYFFRTDIEQPVYTLNKPDLRNAPATPPALTAWVRLRYHQTEVEIGRVVSYEQQPVSIVPPATLALSTHAQLLPDDTRAAQIETLLHPVQVPAVYPLVSAPRGWTTEVLRNQQVPPGETAFAIIAPRENRQAATLKASATLSAGQTVTEAFRSIGYPAIQRTNQFIPATVRIVPAALALPKHRRVGYLPGTGDAVADNLRSIGFEVTPLTVADLTPNRLAAFDTVILGVRTYNAHPDLHGEATSALFEYARKGGNVVVQYQTAEFTAADAPFPLSLGNAEKVVDETTPVRLLEPGTPALTYPNRITAADFNGWIEERGHGFLQSWDPRYTALTETHDPGAPAEHIAPQLPQEGGLVTTTLGHGHWTYVAFALYRQLPEAVPGAFRLFTNLVGLADNVQKVP